MNKEQIFFDIDNTLCTGEVGGTLESCKKCKPFTDKIKIVNSLKDKGYSIILYTARDIKLKEVTENWLKDARVKFDLVIYNKPRFSILIDDRVENIRNISSIEDVIQHIVK